MHAASFCAGRANQQCSRASLQKAALQLLGVHEVHAILLSCLPHKVLHTLIVGLHIVLVLSAQDLSKGSLQAI